jgi:predicted TIM-barrel fold metal-dependent hydrolase
MPDVPATPPHNRTGINYHNVPPRKVAVAGGILDAHNHTREAKFTALFVEVAAAYGVTEFYTMSPLEHVRELQEKFPGKFHFVAVPAWAAAKEGVNDKFFADWTRRIDEFYALGARLIKFHAAPGTCRRWGITLDDPRILAVAKHAYDLGYHFMTHVGDPAAWFCGNGNYSDGTYGTLASQFAMLERMLERYPDRIHLGAHMGGCLEKLDILAKRLDRFPNYVVDTSATKWIVRAVAEQSPAAVRDFVIHYQDRILFGSDLVVGEKYDWDHYASRYWAHQKLWETDFRGESPITDPDAGQGFDPATDILEESKADGIPHLAGLDLPAEVLRKLYRTNAERWLPK